MNPAAKPNTENGQAPSLSFATSKLANGGRVDAVKGAAKMIGTGALAMLTACGPETLGDTSENEDPIGNVASTYKPSTACGGAELEANIRVKEDNPRISMVNDVVAVIQDGAPIPLADGSVPGNMPVEALTDPSCEEVDLALLMVNTPKDWNGDPRAQEVRMLTRDPDGLRKTEPFSFVEFNDQGEKVPSQLFVVDPEPTVLEASDFKRLAENSLQYDAFGDLFEKDRVTVIASVVDLPSEVPGTHGMRFALWGRATDDNTVEEETNRPEAVKILELTPPTDLSRETANDPVLTKYGEGFVVTYKKMGVSSTGGAPEELGQFSIPVNEPEQENPINGMENVPSVAPLANGEGLVFYGGGNREGGGEGTITCTVRSGFSENGSIENIQTTPAPPSEYQSGVFDASVNQTTVKGVDNPCSEEGLEGAVVTLHR